MFFMFSCHIVLKSIKKVTSQSVLGCGTSPFLQPRRSFHRRLPIAEMTCGTPPNVLLRWATGRPWRRYRIWPETLWLFCEELSLEKAKLPPSISSFCAPVATLQYLIVPSLLLETRLPRPCTRVWWPGVLLKISCCQFVPVPILWFIEIYTSKSKHVLSLLNIWKKTNARQHDNCFSLLLTIYNMCVYWISSGSQFWNMIYISGTSNHVLTLLLVQEKLYLKLPNPGGSSTFSKLEICKLEIVNYKSTN